MLKFLSDDHWKSKYYYHGCGNVETLSKVLDSKKICTGRELGLKLEGGVALFNGLDHISVCKKFSDSEYRIQRNNGRDAAFPRYISCKFGLILSNNIKAKKTKIYIGNRYTICEDIYKFVSKNPEKRWSDMFDEYQVEGSIGIDKFKAVFLPLYYIEQGYITYEREYLLNIMKEINRYNLDIVDSCDYRFSERYESPDYNRDEENSNIKMRIKRIIK